MSLLHVHCLIITNRFSVSALCSGSHCKRSEPVFMNSIVVATSDALFSFVAGFAVFSTLGHLAYIENLESIEQLEYASFGLVFGSWPVTLVSSVISTL